MRVNLCQVQWHVFVDTLTQLNSNQTYRQKLSIRRESRESQGVVDFRINVKYLMCLVTKGQIFVLSSKTRSTLYHTSAIFKLDACVSNTDNCVRWRKDCVTDERNNNTRFTSTLPGGKYCAESTVISSQRLHFSTTHLPELKK